MSEIGEKRVLHCDTCGVETEHLHRDVLDEGYNAMLKPPMWNCEACYRKKRTMRLVEGPHTVVAGKVVFLTGFMASGKSKVGPLIAHATERSYCDTDDMIVEAAGKSIPEIFETDGESAFRNIEHDCVRRAGEMGDVVIALGGGAVAQDRNWGVIGSAGLCVCIRASVDTIFERVTRKVEERPLLAGLDDAGRRAKIARMLEEREPYYARADLFVTSDEHRSPEETAAEVISLLREREAAGD